MKNKLILIVFLFLINLSTYAQKVNVYPKNSYVKENLDLNAVGLLYEESTDIADFERKLNFSQDRISNLDLNDDGKVDYLKVSDKIENNIQIINIQSEVSPNIYENVASINIILKNKNRTSNATLQVDRSNANKSPERSSYYNNSQVRATDVIPFIYTVLDVYLILRK